MACLVAVFDLFLDNLWPLYSEIAGTFNDRTKAKLPFYAFGIFVIVFERGISENLDSVESTKDDCIWPTYGYNGKKSSKKGKKWVPNKHIVKK